VTTAAAPASVVAPPRPRVVPLYLGVLVGFHLLLPIAFFPPFFTWWFPVYLIVGNFLFGSLGINLGYHRLLTHRSAEFPKWLERTFVRLGVCCLETPPFRWVCIHRMHHQKSDVDGDPHSPTPKFWWGHMGWIYSEDPRMKSMFTYEKFIPDLLMDPWLRSLHKRNRWFRMYLAHVALLLTIAAGVGYLVGGVDGLIAGTAQMFAWGIVARTVYVWHITWLVNSAAHRWGYQNYDTKDRSRNTWWVAALTNGEGWHNNHHAAPRSAAHGHRWWEVDLTYTFIRVLAAVGLAKNVVPIAVPKQRQMEGAAEPTRTAA